jgi:hypothetical protein
MEARSMDHETSPAKRVAYFKRIFARGIGRTPNALQKHAVARAAQWAAEAERVLADPAAQANDKVRVDNAFRRAKADMDALLTKRQPAHVPLRERLRLEFEAGQAE